jgi:hypothetical protein
MAADIDVISSSLYSIWTMPVNEWRWLSECTLLVSYASGVAVNNLKYSCDSSTTNKEQISSQSDLLPSSSGSWSQTWTHSEFCAFASRVQRCCMSWITQVPLFLHDVSVWIQTHLMAWDSHDTTMLTGETWSQVPSCRPIGVSATEYQKMLRVREHVPTDPSLLMPEAMTRKCPRVAGTVANWLVFQPLDIG